jgi:hypothetical protein
VDEARELLPQRREVHAEAALPGSRTDAEDLV